MKERRTECRMRGVALGGKCAPRTTFSRGEGAPKGRMRGETPRLAISEGSVSPETSCWPASPALRAPSPHGEGKRGAGAPNKWRARAIIYSMGLSLRSAWPSAGTRGGFSPLFCDIPAAPQSPVWSKRPRLQAQCNFPSYLAQCCGRHGLSVAWTRHHEKKTSIPSDLPG